MLKAIVQINRLAFLLFVASYVHAFPITLSDGLVHSIPGNLGTNISGGEESLGVLIITGSGTTVNLSDGGTISSTAVGGGAISNGVRSNAIFNMTGGAVSATSEGGAAQAFALQQPMSFV